MKNFAISIPVEGWCTYQVSAESVQEAVKKARELLAVEYLGDHELYASSRGERTITVEQFDPSNPGEGLK